MHTKTIEVSPEDVNDLHQKEKSIQHWAMKLAGVAMEMRGIESTLHGLYDSRATKLTKLAESGGVDVALLRDLKLQENQLICLMDGEPGDPSADVEPKPPTEG